MSFRKIGFLILSVVLVFSSCKKDDDGDGIVTIPIADRGEQQLKDNDSLVKYLTTHYYNAGAFVGNTNPKIADLDISDEAVDSTYEVLFTDDDIENDPVEIKTVRFADTEYQIYILKLNEGGGEDSPNFSDKVRVVYEGMLRDGSVFDSAVTPVDFNLVGDGTSANVGVITGWKKVMVDFKTAENFMEEGGIVNYENHGVGVMFLPSGLAYFANPPSGIPVYEPLIFKFELLQTFPTDFDNDGIPSHLEKTYFDLTDSQFDDQFVVFEDENEDDDDTDSNGLPDYVDADDDGDGILTRDEIKVRTVTGTKEEVESEPLGDDEQLVRVYNDLLNGKYIGTIIEFTDADNDGAGNGVPDYLEDND